MAWLIEAKRISERLHSGEITIDKETVNLLFGCVRCASQNRRAKL